MTNLIPYHSVGWPSPNVEGVDGVASAGIRPNRPGIMSQDAGRAGEILPADIRLRVVVRPPDGVEAGRPVERVENGRPAGPNVDGSVESRGIHDAACETIFKSGGSRLGVSASRWNDQCQNGMVSKWHFVRAPSLPSAIVSKPHCIKAP